MIGARERVIACCLVSTVTVIGVVACGQESTSPPSPASSDPTSAERPSAEPSSAEDPSAEPSGAETEPEEPTLAEPSPTPGREPLNDVRVHLDLEALSHLADVSHHGLYVDFGTPSRMHYTMGRWHNGFFSDASEGERTFTRMGTDARAWVHSDAAGPRTLRVRARAVGTRAVVVYVNGQRAGQLDFAGNQVEEHDVAVRLGAGENTLMFRSSGTRRVDGEEVAAEIDSLWLLPAQVPTGELSPPRFSERVRELVVGGERRRAVVARGPASLRWYAEIPEGAQLALGMGAASGEGTVRVRVTPARGSARVVHEGPVSARWSDRVLDLAPFVGEVVRLELEVEGTAEVGFSGPAVVVPLPSEPLAQAQARSAVVVLIDTLRATKLRTYEPRSRVQTPALDRFAREAAVFERAQSSENWTKPSVASILTSLTPTTHNTKEQGSSLPDSALMVSEVFQQAGFATASFIANGYVSDRFGFRQGWDHYTNYIRENRRTEAENVFDEAIRWIEAHRGQRFFAYVHTIDPHVPYDPPDDILRIYDAEPYQGPISPRRTGLQLEDVKNGRLTLTERDRLRLEALHDGEITYHDRHFARFLARLRELGLEDEVILLVTADHGEEFNEHGSYGHGHSVFQELLHVPLIARWPGVIEPRRVAPTVSTLDVAPTLLEATNIAIPEVFEGRSLLGMARGHLRPGPAIAFSDKLDDRRVATAAGYKLIVRGNLTWAFFDLRRDPGERQQIDDGSRHPIALRYLRGLLGQFLGASDRGHWLHAGTGGQSRVLPQAESRIDAELCQQLRALGYIDARCDSL